MYMYGSLRQTERKTQRGRHKNNIVLTGVLFISLVLLLHTREDNLVPYTSLSIKLLPCSNHHIHSSSKPNLFRSTQTPAAAATTPNTLIHVLSYVCARKKTQNRKEETCVLASNAREKH